MAESSINGFLDTPAIKTEPEDVFLEDHPIIPKEFIKNGVQEDSDCEDVAYFSQIEVENTKRCLENTRLIIKDFETQLDWHLQQYMALRDIFSKKGGPKDDPTKKQDLLSISQLSALIANHPEGNKKFIKRKGASKKRRRNKETDSEWSDLSDESEEFQENVKGKKGKRGNYDMVVPKDEIEEEVHELIEPKVERDSEGEVQGVPPKRGRKAKKVDTVDLTNIRSCSVILNRYDQESVDIKDEDIDKDELVQLLQSKAIDTLEKFTTDSEKPIEILKQDNYKQFNYDELGTSNVVVTFEDFGNLPEFVFDKKVTNFILNGQIKFVKAEVFDLFLSDQKK
ncbi:uncharacterized protein LOC100141973 [Tribolium castaneum]|uniref:Uncharacterized protein n=1 Tax=Tribolium castaneum TaxID=7070 RepID=D6WMA6_TRICA|nr:PREDICTED: uncharacterized protein LOC100141973 [Tribolium castaneum]EFA04242.1 hypothetical protein TcasGA2_TC014496 [Tribolium castaneum]|eukprot:XP_001809520.1 PREDICTED: uncharacterized protein LOC100141973 [Tribolium castaneum]